MGMDWIRVAPEAELVASLSATAGDSRVAVFRTEGGIFALDDVCSHEYSLLSEGELFDGQVECPKHGSRFDLRTGAVTGFPATKGVRAWEAKAEGGWIWVARR
jgi:3-phenylpropionate/trans-cinnamate dioxygenase ferredoxin component